VGLRSERSDGCLGIARQDRAGMSPGPPFSVSPNEVRGLPFILSLPQDGDFSLRSKRQGGEYDMVEGV
jgi:hypothetical protein